MKNTIKLIGFIVLVAVIGFSFIACPTGSTDPDPDPEPGPLDGKWVAVVGSFTYQLVFSGSDYTKQYDDSGNWEYDEQGTFIISDTNITFVRTHCWNGSSWDTAPYTASGTITILSDTSFSLSGGNLADLWLNSTWNK